MLGFLPPALLSFVGLHTASLAGQFVHWLLAGPLLPWLLMPAGVVVGGFLLLGLLTILDG